MPSPSTTITNTDSRLGFKRVLWLVMGAMTLSVLFYSEIPLLRQKTERAYLSTIPWLIIPHVLAGITAFVSGPLQFSSRLRRAYPKFHRVLGRTYVGAVFVAAPLAIVLVIHRSLADSAHFVIAICIQSCTWMITTAAAFLTARNRHIQQHREWMVRSYAVTFTFVATRFPQPFPRWNRHSEVGFAIEVILITFLAILISDLGLHWKELTSSR